MKIEGQAAPSPAASGWASHGARTARPAPVVILDRNAALGPRWPPTSAGIACECDHQRRQRRRGAGRGNSHGPHASDERLGVGSAAHARGRMPRVRDLCAWSTSTRGRLQRAGRSRRRAPCAIPRQRRARVMMFTASVAAFAGRSASRPTASARPGRHDCRARPGAARHPRASIAPGLFATPLLNCRDSPAISPPPSVSKARQSLRNAEPGLPDVTNGHLNGEVIRPRRRAFAGAALTKRTPNPRRQRERDKQSMFSPF